MAFTIQANGCPAVIVDAADHLRSDTTGLVSARVHLPDGVVLDPKAPHATRRVRHPAVAAGPWHGTQSVEIWVTLTHHPDRPAQTCATTWLVIACEDLDPVAIAFSTLAGEGFEPAPPLPRVETWYEIMTGLLPGLRPWLRNQKTRKDPEMIPWGDLHRIQESALTVVPTSPVTSRKGRPSDVTSALTWASFTEVSADTVERFARLSITPARYYRVDDGLDRTRLVLGYFEQAHEKLRTVLDPDSTPGRDGRHPWQPWTSAALTLAASWAGAEQNVPPNWADRMYTPAGNPIPIPYVQDSFPWWDPEDAARFWSVHKNICGNCQNPALAPGQLADHDRSVPPLLGWASTVVDARDASRYMLAGLTPDDVQAWADHGVDPPSQDVLAVSAALLGNDIDSWDQPPDAGAAKDILLPGP